MVKLTKIKIPVWKSTLRLYTGETMEKLIKEAESYYDGTDLSGMADCIASVFSISHSKHGNHVVMLLPFKDVTQGMIAHECVHAAWEILDYKGQEVTVSNDESLAYLVEYLFDRVDVIHKQQQKLLTKTSGDA